MQSTKWIRGSIPGQRARLHFVPIFHMQLVDIAYSSVHICVSSGLQRFGHISEMRDGLVNSCRRRETDVRAVSTGIVGVYTVACVFFEHIHYLDLAHI